MGQQIKFFTLLNTHIESFIAAGKNLCSLNVSIKCLFEENLHAILSEYNGNMSEHLTRSLQYLFCFYFCLLK